MSNRIQQFYLNFTHGFLRVAVAVDIGNCIFAALRREVASLFEFAVRKCLLQNKASSSVTQQPSELGCCSFLSDGYRATSSTLAC
jgi:hypothetical protein